MPTSFPAQGHVVTFYDHDAGLVAQVAAFLEPALQGTGRGVLVATARHEAAVVAALRAKGLDLGRLVVAEAAETLGRLLVEGVPDRRRFRAVVLPLLGGEPRSVRVFGEMVGLLFGAGEPGGAVQLEALWNELAHEEGFALMCGYPAEVLRGVDLGSTTLVCGAHDDVRGPDSYVGGRPEVGAEAVFVPVPSAVVAARRFVAASLTASGDPELLADASLVLSELATNAVRHAGSAFRVTVHHHGGAVRIGVEDAGTAPPRRRAAGPEEPGGRGVAIVEGVSRRWGCDVTGEGKRVWAELRAARPPGRA